MKIFKTFTLTVLFVLIISQASFSKPIDPNVHLRNAVTKMLVDPDIDAAVNEKVRISFFVTADDQVVVLKTDARTKELDQFIKERMNYHKINIDDLDVNRVFHLKVHFKLEE